MAHADEKFCKSTEGLDRIKSYLTCQANSALAACSGLATALGARMFNSQLEKKYRHLIENNKDILTRNLASQLHDEWREPRKISDPKKYLNDIDSKISDITAYLHGYDQDIEELDMLGKQKKSTAEQIDSMNRKYGNDGGILKAKKSELEALIAKKKEITDALRIAGGKTLYEPRLKVVDGKTYDIANLGYDDLPEQFKFENRESARVAINQINERIKGGGKLNDEFIEKASSTVHDEWLKRNGSWAPENQKLTFSKLSKAEADKDRAIVKKALSLFETQSRAVGGKAFQSALGLARKLGSKGALVAGGVVGAGVFVTTEAFDASPTACSEYNDAVLNRDRNDRCKPVYEVNYKVLAFLNMSPEQQSKFLKDPEVCNFYSKLHDKFFEQPKFVGLECRQTSFTVTTQDRDGVKWEHRVLYRSGGNEIKQVNLRPLSTTTKKYSTVIEVEGNGTIKNIDSDLVARTALPMKLYVMDAYDCCNEKNDAISSVCHQFFNGGTSNTDRGTTSGSKGVQ